MRSIKRIEFWCVLGSESKDRSFGGGGWASAPEGFAAGGRVEERKERKRKKEKRERRERENQFNEKKIGILKQMSK